MFSFVRRHNREVQIGMCECVCTCIRVYAESALYAGNACIGLPALITRRGSGCVDVHMYVCCSN